jgi:hypothetical protein
MDTETVITGGDFATLYAALVAEQRAQLPKNYFTIARFREDTGSSCMTATRILEKLVEAGKLATCRAILDGHITRIFWFPEEAE